jgi:microcystin-dependent protein
MSNYEATKYDFTGANLTGIEGIPTATIVPWSTSSVPTGFLECNGQAVSRSTYSALFAAVGTTYGAGDGSSTFLVPDLQNKVAVSKSNKKALASTGGADTVASTGNVGGSTANTAISIAQVAAHQHDILGGNSPGTQYIRTTGAMGGGVYTGNRGSDGGHSHNMSATFSGSAGSGNGSVLQPYLTILYIIKT